jgi:hypothetical protein
MKRLLESLICLLVAGCSLPPEVMFRSEESKTVSGGPVFNRIRFIRDGASDIWMMNQSHDAGKTFERLAIKVTGKHAEFFQLDPGALDWNNSIGQREYRVSCALCHSNGPRAIRPAERLSVSETLRLSLWNLKIKMYPRIESEAAPGFDHRTPFRFAGTFANSPLKVATCAYCHREDGPIARGTLVRQNALAISSMVANGHMPPLGIPLPAAQRKELDQFLRGF